MNGTVNKVILVGNLGDDVKMHHFDEVNCIGRFPVATTESYMSKDNQKVEQTEWHNIVVRNKLAEICNKYLKKGDKVYIEGKIKTRKWQDDSNQTRYTTEIVALSVQFLTPKGSQENSSSSASSAQSEASTSFEETSFSDPQNEVDDLPF